MVVGYGVGGPSDTIARIIAERMKPALGQPIVVENITGAAGSIGMGRLARAMSDVYTIGLGDCRRCASMLRCTICHTMW